MGHHLFEILIKFQWLSGERSWIDFWVILGVLGAPWHPLVSCNLLAFACCLACSCLLLLTLACSCLLFVVSCLLLFSALACSRLLPFSLLLVPACSWLLLLALARSFLCLVYSCSLPLLALACCLSRSCLLLLALACSCLLVLARACLLLLLLACSSLPLLALACSACACLLLLEMKSFSKQNDIVFEAK